MPAGGTAIHLVEHEASASRTASALGADMFCR